MMFKGIAIPILVLLSADVTVGHTLKASEKAVEVKAEAKKVMLAAQKQVLNLPPSTRGKVVNALASLLNNRKYHPLVSTTAIKQPQDVLRIDPGPLTLQESSELVSLIQQAQQRTMQVVDPNMTPSPSFSPDPEDLISGFTASTPLTPAEVQRYTQNASRLPILAKSVGRLLWSEKNGATDWKFKSTVFVTQKNVVATNCHALDEDVVDVTNDNIVLRKDRLYAVDFSDAELGSPGVLANSTVLYPVVDVITTGTAQGCDIALLRIDHADSIIPLVFADEGSSIKRIVIIGYPLLSDLTQYTCPLEDTTGQFFCKFKNSHPGVGKVRSPGAVYTFNSHAGVDVFTYNAPTREGFSGSPVIDLDTLHVVGIHYCCTGANVSYTLKCAMWHPQKLTWNEAIASKTLVNDSRLKEFIEVLSQTASTVYFHF